MHNINNAQADFPSLPGTHTTTITTAATASMLTDTTRVLYSLALVPQIETMMTMTMTTITLGTITTMMMMTTSMATQTGTQEKKNSADKVNDAKENNGKMYKFYTCYFKLNEKN